MSFSWDDVIAIIGLACLLAGVYLWFGLPPALIILGLVLVYIGAKLPVKVRRGEENGND